MRYLLIIIVFFSLATAAQKNNVFILGTKSARISTFSNGWIALDTGWRFKAGDNLEWAKPDFNDSSWTQVNLISKLANVPGIQKESIAWFRIRLMTDSTLIDRPLVMRVFQTGASELYLDGQRIHQLGTVSKDLALARYYSPNANPLSFPLTGPSEHLLAIRFLPLPGSFPLYSPPKLSLETWITTTDNAADDAFIQYHRSFNGRLNICFGAGIILCILYFSFFVFFPDQKLNLYFSLCNLFFIGVLIFSSISLNYHGAQFKPAMAVEGFTSLYVLMLLYCIYKIFSHKIGWVYWTLLSMQVIGVLLEFFIAFDLNSYILILVIVEALRITVNAVRNKKPGAWIVLAFTAVDLIYFTLNWLAVVTIVHIQTLGSYLPFALLIAPVGLAIYLGYTFAMTSQILRQKLAEVEQLSDEKQQILSAQNETLEKQVKERTLALNESLEDLKATQSQLVQAEKMASLGELTAGIAHEIQNPLNFVNNFSEVNTELIEELKAETHKADGERNLKLQEELLSDIEENLGKINYHGKRVDAIVKGMLQHSQSGKGEKEPTAINALADEYLRLAYHGLRAKDKTFNAILKTDYDESIGNINVVPQDMGRVILNLITNAFYAVNEKKKDQPDYEPIVTVSTKGPLSFGEGRSEVEIRVTDNGNGIPPKIIDKIFQPFFTTKPTGQGTGLGLSLAYDIVKAHGGDIKVESKEQEGTTFIIQVTVKN